MTKDAKIDVFSSIEEDVHIHYTHHIMLIFSFIRKGVLTFTINLYIWFINEAINFPITKNKDKKLNDL